MNRSDPEGKSGSQSTVSSAAPKRLSGSWLLIARTVWLALVVFSLGLVVAGFPPYYQQLQTACVGPVACNIVGALPAEGFHELSALGLTASEYAAWNTIFWAIIMLIWCGIGFLIFLRRSDDWLALLAAFTLVMFNTGVITPSLAMGYAALIIPATLTSFLGQVAFVLFFLLFPNGRFIPRWTGLVALLGIVQAISIVAPPTSPLSTNNLPNWLNGLLSLVIDGSIIFSQIYRYRRVSTSAQRQQTKWVVFSIIIIVAGFLVFYPLFAAIGITQTTTPASDILQLAYPLLILLLPICTCISILRYRLYDIDTVINRTLVYGLLTSILAASYFGLIFGLQFLLRGIITTNNEVAIVVSTLVTAALFQPLRVRIQKVIDRRFYRRKYDAARTVAAFSATLRNEVDLNQLREQLVVVVKETMQPAHVSLWVRSPAPDRKQQTTWSNPLPVLLHEREQVAGMQQTKAEQVKASKLT